MKQAKKSLIHKNDKVTLEDQSLTEYIELTPLTKKQFTHSLLASLENAKNHYETEFLNLDKTSIPRDFLHIFWGLKNEVQDFLDRYPYAEGYTLPGKKLGRNKNDAAREIASKVLIDYRVSKGDASAIPTGQYLFEKINEIINIKALAGELCPMDVKLRTCQLWAKEIRDGCFDLQDTDDFV
jgi:hypothetical protein